jgi:hypothetical protein
MVERRGAAKHEAVGPVLAGFVRDQNVAERPDDRDGSATGPALRLDLDVLLLVVGPLDSDDAVREVHVSPSEGHQLAAAEARVEGCRPDRSIAVGYSSQEALGLLGRRDPLTSAADGWQPEVSARVDRQVAVLDRPAEDHAEGHERVPDRRRVAPVGKKVVCDPLRVAVLNVTEAPPTDARDDVVAERRLVASDRARLVEVAGARPDAAGLHPGDKLLSCVADGRVRRRAQRASPDTRLRLGAPRSRLGEGREGLTDARGLTRAPDARLVGRLAVAAATTPRRAGLLVPHFDARSLRHRHPRRGPIGRSARQSRDSPRAPLAISALEAVRRQ